MTSAKQGSERVQRVSASIGAFTGSVTQVRELAQAVKDASREQQRGIDEVATAVQRMTEVTSRTAAVAEESAAASEQLTAQAETSRAHLDELAAIVSAQASAEPVPAEGRGELRTFTPKPVALKRVS